MASVQHRALSGSIANVVCMASLFLQNIAMVPVMLRHWGGEMYGVWIATNALQSLVQTVDNGQQNYLGNEFNRLFHQDRVFLERLLSTGLCSMIFLEILQLLLVFAVRKGGILAHLLGLRLNSAMLDSAWLALLIFVLGWIFSGSVGGLLVRLTYAVGYYARYSWWGVAQRTLLCVGVVVAVERGAGLVAAAIAYSAVQIGVNIFQMADMIFILRRVGIRLRMPSARLAVSIFGKSLMLTGTGFLDAASTSGLFTLVSALFTAAALPLFTTLRTVANVATQCVSTIMNPLFPEMSRYSARNEIDKLNEVTAVCWLVAGTLINVGLLSSILFIAPLYALWTHGKLPFRPDLFVLLALSVAIKAVGAPWYGYLVCTNALAEQLWATFLRGAVSLGATFLLAASCGLRSAGIALVCAELGASLLLPLFFTQRAFRRRGHSVQWRPFSLALASLLIIALAFVVFAANLAPSGLPVAVGVAGIGLIAFAQWQGLLPETRGRLLSMVSRERKDGLVAAV